jgi:DNA repair exonuclease SbcCD ATPase subunit
MSKLNLPELKKIEINNFSLYRKASRITSDISKNVFCLAGANGLGKSTFITILNYGLTGIVKNPDRAFTWYNSIPAFYSKSKSFSSTYFNGRITEENRELAEVSIEFLLNGHQYLVTRGFFETDELRSFKKIVDGKNIIPDELDSRELEVLYKQEFQKDSLLEFDQFVFLQSYLLTFDETHQLLFWDGSLMERVLYLFFGLDSEKAKKADRLRKDFNKYDSNVRNTQWNITKTRNELSNILNSLETQEELNTNEFKILRQYEHLIASFDELSNKSEVVFGEITDCDVEISDISLQISSLRGDYDKAFNETLNDETPIEKDKGIIKLLQELSVLISENQNFQKTLDGIVELIRTRQKKVMPTKESFDRLNKIDAELLELTNKLNTQRTKKERLGSEAKDVSLKMDSLKGKIEKIEDDNKSLFDNQKVDMSQGISAIKKSYEEQIARYLEQKDEHTKKRETSRKELNELEKVLNKSYLKAESEFIPIFNEYARSFLGLDVSISLSTSVKGANLSLQIDDTTRRDAHQLSESQRYFVDIALRMALIELNTNTSTMLIDTPEGSLDIAYESRAGTMLASFAQKGFKIVMTSNINSSQLLLQLASLCKNKYMSIEKMTNWTTLSDVQQQENSRIENAFKAIEDALK